jgi:predicted dehydrogenase
VSKIKIGVIGTGSIAQMHLGAYVTNPDVELVAVSDINAERAQAVADQYGAKRTYGDPNDLLADPEVDGVSICTWNNSHASWAIAAVQAGKHVLVEKPISRTYAEALELKRVVEEHDRVVQVGFVRRHFLNCQVLKSFIDAGDLGDIYYAKASCIRRVGNPGGWFADKDVAGGGPLLDIGVHVIDLCWYLMGSPQATAVSGHIYSHLGNRANLTNMPRYKVSDYDPAKNSVEDLANAVVRFDNGASLLVDASYSLHAVKNSIDVEVYGNKGGAELEPELRIATERHDTVINIEPQIASRADEIKVGFTNEIANFVDASLGRAESIAPAWHGVEIMKILDGIYASADSGKEITLV